MRGQAIDLGEYSAAPGSGASLLRILALIVLLLGCLWSPEVLGDPSPQVAATTTAHDVSRVARSPVASPGGSAPGSRLPVLANPMPLVAPESLTENDMTLLRASQFWLLVAAAVSVLLGRLFHLPTLMSEVPARWTHWLAVAALAGLSAVLVWTLTEPGAWHSNYHGIERLDDLLRGHTRSIASGDVCRSSLVLVHGCAYYIVFSPLTALVHPWMSVFMLSTLVSMATLVVWFAAIQVLTERRDVAWAATCLLALAPVHLKISGTESMYVATELYLALTVLSFALYFRSPSRREFFLGACSLFLLMHSRGEWMLLGPVLVTGMMLALRPHWLATAWRRPSILLTIGAFVVFFVPRLAVFATLSKISTGTLKGMGPWQWPERWLPIALALLFLATLPRVRDVYAGIPRRRLRYGLTLVGSAALIGMLLAGGGWHHSGVFSAHVFIDPRFTAPVYPLLFLLGFIDHRAAAWRQCAWLTLYLAFSTLLYQFHYDVLSTYVRAGIALFGLGCIVAGYGLSRITTSISKRWGPRSGALAAVAIPLVSLLPYGPWLGRVHVKQQMWELVDYSWHQLPEGAVVGVITRDDFAPELHDTYMVIVGNYEKYLAAPDRQIVSLGELVRTPVTDNSWFLLGPECFRPLRASGNGKREVLLGDAIHPIELMPAPKLSAQRRTVIRDVDVDAYIQPACRQVLEAFSLTPVHELELSPWVAGALHEEWIGTSRRIGLYRIGPRASGSPASGG